MRAIALLAAAIGLAGCDTAQTPANGMGSPDAERLTWRAASGGGQIARTEYASETPDYRSSTATRCWPVAGRQDCVVVRSTTIGGYSARRFTTDTLPATREAVDELTDGPGYSCDFDPEHRLSSETIAGERDTLVEQSWLSIASTRPWTKRYVTGFMRDNAVDGSPWFRCVDLMQALDRGSMETVGSTLVSRAILD